MTRGMAAVPRKNAARPTTAQLMPIISESPCERVARPARVMIAFIVAGYTQYPQMPNPTHPITAYISGISASRRFSRAANESAAHSSTNPTVYTNATANRQATRNHGIRANAPPAALTITGALTSSHTHMTKAMETACTSIVGNPVSGSRVTFVQFAILHLSSVSGRKPSCM